jgi:hypothetical protein
MCFDSQNQENRTKASEVQEDEQQKHKYNETRSNEFPVRRNLIASSEIREKSRTVVSCNEKHIHTQETINRDCNASIQSQFLVGFTRYPRIINDHHFLAFIRPDMHGRDGKTSW